MYTFIAIFFVKSTYYISTAEIQVGTTIDRLTGQLMSSTKLSRIKLNYSRAVQ